MKWARRRPAEDRVAVVKGHGTGNDFVLIPDPDGIHDFSAAAAAALCDRRMGIGGDGVLRVVRSDRTPEGADYGPGAPEWFMDYRNSDGSIAEMCGNGIRVFARFLVDAGLASPGELEVLTRGGVYRVNLHAEGDVTVDMGRPIRDGYSSDVRVRLGSHEWRAEGLGLPNPHAVVVLDDLTVLPAELPPPEVAPAVMYPDGVNVEFVEFAEEVVPGQPHVRMRVHERGSGETLSCGTGACAVGVVVAEHLGVPDGTPVQVDVPGGTLMISIDNLGRVHMSGPAVIVADGWIVPRWWRAHT